MSLAGARWLARRCPAYRRREPDLLLLHGTWEGGCRYCPSVLNGAVGERESVVRRKPETLSTDAVPAGGPARSSGEALVMGVERRGRLIGELFARATGIVPGGDEWASQVWQKSRL